MGEREITEQVEVTERESVHVCDFCGRDSDEFDGTFNEVYKNPKVNLRQYPPGYRNNQFTIQSATRTTNGEIKISAWKETPYISIESDEEKHYCDECCDAHLEVHNDDS